MADIEKKQKKKIQTIVASAVTFFCLLVLTLAILLIANLTLQSSEKHLLKLHDQLENELKSLDHEIEIYDPNSDAYKNLVDEYSKKVLGYAKDGSEILILN